LQVARFAAPAVLVTALLLLAPAVARGDETPREAPALHVGERGSFVFGAAFGLGAQQGLDGADDTILAAELQPAFDAFLAPRLSLGVGAVVSATLARASPGSSLVGVSPRVGYVVPIGSVFALWPRVSIDFAYATQGQPTAGFHDRILSSSLYVPVLAFLLPRVALGAGPSITQQLLNRTDAGVEPSATIVQLLVEATGWF
jgi:hypothetical protein